AHGKHDRTSADRRAGIDVSALVHEGRQLATLLHQRTHDFVLASQVPVTERHVEVQFRVLIAFAVREGRRTGGAGRCTGVIEDSRFAGTPCREHSLELPSEDAEAHNPDSAHGQCVAHLTAMKPRYLY